MSYVIRTDAGWEPLRWPARKLADGTLVRPGTEGTTPALLDAVGAVAVVDTGPDYDPALQVLVGHSLSDVAGTPTIVYTYRDRTAQELAADADNAEREAKAVSVGQAVTWLRARAAEYRAHTATVADHLPTTNTMIDNDAVFFDGFADLLEGLHLDRRG